MASSLPGAAEIRAVPLVSVTVPAFVPAISTMAPESGLPSLITVTETSFFVSSEAVATLSAGVFSVSAIRISAARVVSEKAHRRPITAGSVPASRSRECLPGVLVVIILKRFLVKESRSPLAISGL